MKLSKLASEIVESPTLALNEEARILRERGEPVIHLGDWRTKEQNAHQRHSYFSSQALQRGGEVHAGIDGMHPLKKASHPLYRGELRPPGRS
jgi:hypothetical protein